ncbi:Tetratricopeptide repeat protein [Nymphaea thermarum]|nr:Tetratricopeptide repeat protein [Nymphaea thermarum]
MSFCRNGLEVLPTNEDMKKLLKQIELKIEEDENRKAQISKALGAAKDIVCALEIRHLRMGKAVYQELTGVRKPKLENNILHWPVLLLYAEVMSSDFIEDFCEVDTFSAHLDMMYSEGPPLPWDKECVYIREAIELYYEAESGFLLSNKELLRHMLEGTPGALTEPFEEEQDGDSSRNSRSPSGPRKWIKVDERKTLHDVLKKDNYIIPGIPVFYVVSTRSHFYKEFKSGKWTPP